LYPCFFFFYPGMSFGKCDVVVYEDDFLLLFLCFEGGHNLAALPGFFLCFELFLDFYELFFWPIVPLTVPSLLDRMEPACKRLFLFPFPVTDFFLATILAPPLDAHRPFYTDSISVQTSFYQTGGRLLSRLPF